MLELRGPVVAALEVTPAGPAWSGHAYFKGETRPPLTPSQWGDVVEKLGAYVSEFRVCGGEPTTRPDLLEILDHLERAKRPYHIFTTGVWSDRPSLLLGLKKLTYIQSFLVYLHGHDAETHGAFTGNAEEFDEVVKTIELVAATGLEVNTSTVITRQNAAHAEALVDLANRRGARHAVFNRYVGPPRPDVEPDRDTLKAALASLDDMRQLGYNVALGTCVPACYNESFSQGCSAGITYCAVDPWGQMRPCDHSPTRVGNVLEHKVLDIWRGKAMRAWRNRLPSACTTCSKVTFCPGGCRSEAELLGVDHDPLIGSPLPVEPPALLEVTLEEDLCPLPKYDIREEDFGWSLIRQTHVIPVTKKAGTLLYAFDGKTTLADIEKRFGAAALSFVYSLYERNFVDFRPRDMAEITP
ncbi:MAG: radical SAM protein [Proteobacteria bacterium]|nr:radical SAM protein [Pseudomonadota bacterium]